MKKEILKLHADFCRIFSNPMRLEILWLLMSGELTAGDIAAKLEVNQANASQHLALMRMARILTTRREGTNVYYGIANEKICRACSLMQEGLEQFFGAPAAKQFSISPLVKDARGELKEEQYAEDSKKCVDHVFP